MNNDIVRILCVKANSVSKNRNIDSRFICFGGDSLSGSCTEKDLDIVFNNSLWLEKNPSLEEDERYLQVIPYVLLRNGNRFFAYRRSVKEGEPRLHGLVSVGLGGHTELCDAPKEEMEIGSEMSKMTILNCAQREIEEETGKRIEIDPKNWLICEMIYDTSNPVGRVHLGFVVVVKCNEQFVPSENLDHIGWLSADEILEMTNLGLTESWTSLISKKLSYYCIESYYSSLSLGNKEYGNFLTKTIF